MQSDRNRYPDLSNASIDWDGAKPVSTDFDDIYFSVEDGLKESHYVFIENNHIPERLADKSNRHFCVAETGFGTGLNFLATLQAFDRHASGEQQLHYISVEKYPLSKNQLERALEAWPELNRDRQELLEQYPDLLPGAHRRHFRDGRVSLTLIFGDVHEDFPEYDFTADAWFLDGFNPAQNPDMWDIKLYELMAKRSKSSTTFATFTAAGFVRRGLQSAGFEVERVPGFGRKREMLVGRLATCTKQSNTHFDLPQWLGIKDARSELHDNQHVDVIVIGAGIAGLNSAYACARKGLRTLLLEQNESAVSEASGQERLIMYSKLPAQWNQEARLSLSYLEYAQYHYSQRQKEDIENYFWNLCGQIQLAWNHAETERSTKRRINLPLPEEFMRYVDASEASRLAGMKLKKGGFWFPKNGQVDPRKLADTILKHPLISLKTNTAVSHLSQSDTGEWTAHSSAEDFSGRNIILANAFAAKSLLPEAHLPIKQIRGQVTSTQSEYVTSPKCVLCGEGYFCAGEHAHHQHFGATYELKNLHSQVADSEHVENIAKLRHWLPELEGIDDLYQQTFNGSAGLRCTSADYQAIAGPVPDFQALRAASQILKTNAKAIREIRSQHQKGLYINIAHGSKGLVSSALCAEYLSDLITGSPVTLSREQRQMLHPARFLLRELIRNQT